MWLQSWPLLKIARSSVLRCVHVFFFVGWRERRKKSIIISWSFHNIIKTSQFIFVRYCSLHLLLLLVEKERDEWHGIAVFEYNEPASSKWILKKWKMMYQARAKWIRFEISCVCFFILFIILLLFLFLFCRFFKILIAFLLQVC